MIKCASLWQPWASLLFVPEPMLRKEFETRTWFLPRGVTGLVIHAAKHWTREEQQIIRLRPFAEAIMSLGGIQGPTTPSAYDLKQHLPLGAFIGYVDIPRCVRTEDVEPRLSRTERAFGNWSSGRVAWQTANPLKFDEPIPARGQQGLWEPPMDVLRLIPQAEGMYMPCAGDLG